MSRRSRTLPESWARFQAMRPARWNAACDWPIFCRPCSLPTASSLPTSFLARRRVFWADPKCEPKQADGEAVAWIVNGDAALLDDVVAAIVSDESSVEANLDQKLTCILHCVRGQPCWPPCSALALLMRANQLAATAALEKTPSADCHSKANGLAFDSGPIGKRTFYKTEGENSRDAL